MRKKVIFMLLIMLCFCMGGCRPVNEEQKFKVRNTSEKLQGNQIMEEIVAALDTGDVERLKAMFSEVALKEYDEWIKSEGTKDGEMTNLDEQISSVMEFYQGIAASYEGTVDSSKSFHYGDSVLTLRGQYILETDIETYYIRFQYRSIDDENYEAIGLSRLEIVTKENYDRDEFRWQLYIQKGYGVYWQDYDKYELSWKNYGKGPDGDLLEEDW